MAQIKEAGFDPFYMPTTGNDGYIFTWYVVLLSGHFMDEVVAQCDGQAGEEANGVISQKEAVWCIDKGIWNARDPGVVQTLEKWSEFYHEGYLAPSAPGNMFPARSPSCRPCVCSCRCMRTTRI